MAQDTIIMTTGKMIKDIEVMEIGSDYVLYQEWKKNDKIKERVVDRFSVYSIHYKNGTNMIIYKEDSLQGFSPNAEQMKSYVDGQIQSREFYQNKSATIGGIVIGVAAASVTGIIGVSPLFTIIVPSAYTAILAAWEPNVDKYTDITEEQKKDFYFMEGYRDYARMKKVKNAVLSSHISYIATLGLLLSL
jgi:hypothetical protein